MEAAMDYGTSDMDLSTLLVSGPPGSGKTHLRYYFYGQLPPAIRISTACIESAHRGIILESEERITVEAVDDLKPIIASAVRDMNITEFQEDDTTENTPVISRSPSVSEEDMEVEKEVKVENSIKPQPMVHDQQNVRPKAVTIPSKATPSIPTHLSPSVSDAQPQESSATSLSVKKATLDWLKTQKVRLQLKGHWVHFVDTGGQQQFLDIIPCLINNIGLLVLVVKLSEELSDHTVVEYWDPRGGHYLGKFKLSNEELLAYTAQLSQYHVTEIDFPFVKTPIGSSKILVVGTFKDQEHNCTQSRQDKNERLENILKPFKEALICQTQSRESDVPGTSDIIFAVNTLLAGKGDEEEEKMANTLRHIVKYDVPKCKLRMPLQYFFLEEELRKEAVVTKSYAWEVAQQLYFKTDEDLECCLSYLHRVNLFFYYPNSLPDTVITQPDAVVSVITQIFKHHLWLSENRESVVSETDKRFLNQAVFSIELLQMFQFDYNTSILPHSKLMLLFQHRLIVAPVFTNGSTAHFFMPSLLAEIPPLVFRESYQPKSHLSSPLTISFPKDWVPNGVHSALTNKLLNFKGKASFELATTYQLSMHKSVKNVMFMKVNIDNVTGNMSIVNTMEHLEIYISNLSHTYLPLIEDIIDENLQAVYTTLSYRVSHRFGILCECGQKPRHAAFLPQDKNALICSMKHESYPKQQKVHKASHLIGKMLGI